MKRISMLNEQVYLRIAAGEVVANPAAVVKELCENSLDAGASAITIEIKEGGKKYIRVSDSGSGIHNDDILLTIQKHATSKIANLEDLSNISTMGFRGEALASISAVSNLTISSRTKDSIEGTILEIKENNKNVSYAGLPEGTAVTVENLFYNVPARLKFLKNTTRETVAITNIISKLILANPNISFKYFNNEKLIYQSPGNDNMLDALMSIYDSSIKHKVKQINYENDDIYITGFVTEPNFLYKSTSNISIFVNGRYVKSKSIQNQIINSYNERLLKSHFPLAVLNIHIPYNLADVNVHPNKLEILFDDETYILHCVDIAVRRALQSATAPALQIVVPLSKNENKSNEIAEKLSISPKMPNLRNADKLYEKPVKLAQTYLGSRNYDSKETGNIEAKDIFNIKDFDIISNVVLEKQEQQTMSLSEISNYKLIGQVFDTYIVIESNESIYIIDQHAAHERILFEQLKANINIQSQNLLIAHIMKLRHSDFEIVLKNIDVLKEIGFEIEEFGTLTIKINAVPLTIGENSIETLLDDVLNELKTSSKVIVMKDKLIRAACRYSIKAGQPLSDNQIKDIVGEITNSMSIPNCPHGRPIAVCITKEELEKGFKRIV